MATVTDRAAKVTSSDTRIAIGTSPCVGVPLFVGFGVVGAAHAEQLIFIPPEAVVALFAWPVCHGRAPFHVRSASDSTGARAIALAISEPMPSRRPWHSSKRDGQLSRIVGRRGDVPLRQVWWKSQKGNGQMAGGRDGRLALRKQLRTSQSAGPTLLFPCALRLS